MNTGWHDGLCCIILDGGYWLTAAPKIVSLVLADFTVPTVRWRVLSDYGTKNRIVGAG